MKNIFKYISILLCIVTFIGVLWIFLTEGKASYLFALIPMILNIVVITLYIVFNRLDRK